VEVIYIKTMVVDPVRVVMTQIKIKIKIKINKKKIKKKIKIKIKVKINVKGGRDVYNFFWGGGGINKI
jgi:hypothetical protein